MIDAIVLVGGGGHCKACIDVIESTPYTIAGVLDKGSLTRVLDYKVIGNDEALRALAEKGYSFLVTVGQIKTASVRKMIFEQIKTVKGKLAVVVSSSALVSKYSILGEGTIVMHGAIINASSQIGNNCIINNKALIEHDCVIGDHVHVSTAAVINGGCKIGNGVFIGSNSVLAQGVDIGDDVVIGAGSVVLNNIQEIGIYAGNPAKKISHE
jgi:sugar O-acyltransferase (sialic acid O-acetyltransferase NeuD family)